MIDKKAHDRKAKDLWNDLANASRDLAALTKTGQQMNLEPTSAFSRLAQRGALALSKGPSNGLQQLIEYLNSVLDDMRGLLDPKTQEIEDAKITSDIVKNRSARWELLKRLFSKQKDKILSGPRRAAGLLATAGSVVMAKLADGTAAIASELKKDRLKTFNFVGKTMKSLGFLLWRLLRGAGKGVSMAGKGIYKLFEIAQMWATLKEVFGQIEKKLQERYGEHYIKGFLSELWDNTWKTLKGWWADLSETASKLAVRVKDYFVEWWHKLTPALQQLWWRMRFVYEDIKDYLSDALDRIKAEIVAILPESIGGDSKAVEKYKQKKAEDDKYAPFKEKQRAFLLTHEKFTEEQARNYAKLGYDIPESMIIRPVVAAESLDPGEVVEQPVTVPKAANPASPSPSSVPAKPAQPGGQVGAASPVSLPTWAGDNGFRIVADLFSIK